MTRPLPTVVRREGLVPEEPWHVRGVAKRVPSALPALGGDEIPDAPASARANADRRRRAREAAAGDSDTEGDPVGSPTPSIPRQRGPESDRTAVNVGGPEVELMPIGGRARDVDPVPGQLSPVPMGQPPLASASAPEPGTGQAAGGRHATPAPGAGTGQGHATPYSGGGQATPPPPPAAPVMGQPPKEPERPASTKPGAADIIDAEIVYEVPPPYIAADIETDEWYTVPPRPAAPVPPPRRHGPLPQGPPPVHGPQHSGPPEGPVARHTPPPRPGVSAADPWETAPLPPVEVPRRGGRRRWRRPARTSKVGWLVVLGVVLSLSAAVAVPFLIPLGDSADPATVPEGPVSPSRSQLPSMTIPAGGWTLATAPPPTLSSTPSSSGTPTVAVPGTPGTLNTSGVTSSSVNLSWGASSGTVSRYLIERCTGGGCTNFRQIATSSGTAHTAGGLSPGTTYRFRVRAENEAGQSGYSNIAITTTTASMTLEAEAGSRTGCAVVSNFPGASGGKIVDRIGHQDDWTGCIDGNGVLTFANVYIAAGTYTITVYHVFAQQSTDTTRAGLLRLDPTAAGANIDFDHTYSRTTTIQGWTTASFTLTTAGTYTITFSNPGVSGQDRSPALDRIVIQKTA